MPHVMRNRHRHHFHGAAGQALRQRGLQGTSVLVKKPARKRSTPKPLADALGRFLRQAGLETTLLQVEVMQRWKDVVGASMAGHSWPELLKEGELVVGVDHPAWRQEVHLRQVEIMQRLNQALGRNVVKSLSLVVKSKPMAVAPVVMGPPRQEAVEMANAAAAPVMDEVLANALRRTAAASIEARFQGRLK